MILRKILVFGLVVFSLACEKDELPLERPIENKDVFLEKIELTSDYRYQVWYDVGTQSIVKTNLKTDWDISFDCSDSTSYVYLNSSLAARGAITSFTNFDSVTTINGLEFNADYHSGDKDSLGFGNWKQHGKILIMDRGLSINGNPLGYRKIELSESNGIYTFRYAKLDGSDEHTVQIAKNAAYNWQAFSFKTDSIVNIEPPKETYDLCFTQYMHIFYQPAEQYLVVGSILNHYKVQVAEEFNVPFADISISGVENRNFSRDWDLIGYDWKFFDLGTNEYTIYPRQNYIIKTVEGEYFKLHFIDFLDENGVKGNPLFELQKL